MLWIGQLLSDTGTEIGMLAALTAPESPAISR